MARCRYLTLIQEATSKNYIRNSPISMHINIFSVIEFVTFGIPIYNFVFDVSSSNNFRRLLDKVDLFSVYSVAVIVDCYYFVGHI